MPRTKRPQRKASTVVENAHAVEELLDSGYEADMKMLASYQAAFETKIKCMCDERRLSIPRNKLHLTLVEYINSNDSTINKSTKKRSVSRSTNHLSKRSISVGEDEGYRTTDSCSGSGVAKATRQSRSTLRSASKPRTSRSLSRTNLVKPTPNRSNLKTPANKKRPPTNVGTITPKVNLSKPQALLRRPRTGEVAVSLQGSPLLTGAYANTEETANINIPLPDGRLLSLQPSRAFRASQVPDFGDDIKKQLETLRDNLNKVFAKH